MFRNSSTLTVLFTVLSYKSSKLDSHSFSQAKMIFLLCCIGSIALVNGQEEILHLRIIGGDKARPGQIPFATRLFYEYVPYCTASIIHNNWALTAAHCILSEMGQAQLLVGSVNSVTDTSGEYYEVEKLIKHEKYRQIPAKKNNGKEYVVNDIGLVRLKTPIVFSQKVQPIILPNFEENYDNTIAWIAGFGLYVTSGAENHQLRFGKMRVISDEQCRAFYPYVEDQHICAEIIDSKSPCRGDSGGPLYLTDNLQIGIMSTIADEDICNPNAGPSLFVKVSSFKPWIQQYLAAYGEELS